MVLNTEFFGLLPVDDQFQNKWTKKIRGTTDQLKFTIERGFRECNVNIIFRHSDINISHSAILSQIFTLRDQFSYMPYRE